MQVVIQIFDTLIVLSVAVIGVVSYFTFEYWRHKHLMRRAEHDKERATVEFHRVKTQALVRYANQGANLKVHGDDFEGILFFPPPASSYRINMEPPEEQKQIAPPQYTQPTMDEAYSAVKFNALEVPLGRSLKSGEMVVQGIVSGVHFKLIGASGFGKSCLAGALLDVATRRNNADHLRIALLDLEHKTSRLFENLPHVMNVTDGRRTVSMVATDADEVARHLGWLRKELDRRALKGVSLPLLFIYVEEMLSLQYEVDPKLKEQMLADLAILALRGRKYGMFLMACTQTDYSTKELKEAQKQFRTRSGFGVDPSAARAAGFVNNELIKYNFQYARPGRFLLEKPGFSEMVLAPLYDVEQKLEELSNPSRLYVPNSQWVESDGSVVVPDHFPGNETHIQGNHARKQAEVDNEQLDLVREMLTHHKSQNEIIAKVFPGMRNSDAIVEYRKLLASLVGGS